MEALHRYLGNLAGIRAQVGGCLYVGRVPRQAVPLALTMRRISAETYYSLANEQELRHSIVEMSSWATNPKGFQHATALDELVRDALSGFDRTNTHGGLMGGLAITGCTSISGPNDTTFKPEDGTDKWTFRVSTDYRICHEQAIPSFGLV